MQILVYNYILFKTTFILICILLMMATHTNGITVRVVDTNCSKGRLCEEHDICGSVLAEDVVVQVWKVQVLVNDKKVFAIGIYLVSEGMDCCHVGFSSAIL
jgi:hypothetical protein